MATRYPFPRETRKFGGKVYNYLMVGTKAESEKEAQRYREKGYSVRIVPWLRKYAIYMRKVTR